MSDTTRSSAYWKGFRDGLPFLLVIVPFGLLFGVVATEAGLNVLETLSFSIVVIAGAAQFTAVQLLSEDAPTIVVLASALAVNLRMAMYSASLTPYLGAAPFWQRALAGYLIVDQSYACAIIAYEKNTHWSPRERFAYLAGVVTPIGPLWCVMTIVGALIGSAIPPEYALDFALPITFVAMVAPLLRSLPHLAAAVVAVAASLMFAGLPYNLGLLVSAAFGMVTGAQVELWLGRRSVTVSQGDGA